MIAVGQEMHFTEWLQGELDKRGWSQSDCARAADLNRAVINKILNGRCKPRPVTLIALARGLRIPVEAAYRAAGLLPFRIEENAALQELTYLFNRLQSPDRKATALLLIKALVTEEENQLRGEGKEKH